MYLENGKNYKFIGVSNSAQCITCDLFEEDVVITAYTLTVNLSVIGSIYLGHDAEFYSSDGGYAYLVPLGWYNQCGLPPNEYALGNSRFLGVIDEHGTESQELGYFAITDGSSLDDIVSGSTSNQWYYEGTRRSTHVAEIGTSKFGSSRPFEFSSIQKDCNSGAEIRFDWLLTMEDTASGWYNEASLSWSETYNEDEGEEPIAPRYILKFDTIDSAPVIYHGYHKTLNYSYTDSIVNGRCYRTVYITINDMGFLSSN